jgi:hypothetical protein
MCKKQNFVAIYAHTWFIVLYVFRTIAEGSYTKFLCFCVTTSKHNESINAYHSYSIRAGVLASSYESYDDHHCLALLSQVRRILSPPPEDLNSSLYTVLLLQQCSCSTQHHQKLTFFRDPVRARGTSNATQIKQSK